MDLENFFKNMITVLRMAVKSPKYDAKQLNSVFEEMLKVKSDDKEPIYK